MTSKGYTPSLGRPCRGRPASKARRGTQAPPPSPARCSGNGRSGPRWRAPAAGCRALAWRAG
eukprot:130557-Prorocentrum_minimum.AAC.3